MQNRIYIKDLKDSVEKEIIIAGWIDARRDQGKMVFFDMRDMTGKVQCVILPNRMADSSQGKILRRMRIGKILRVCLGCAFHSFRPRCLVVVFV